MMGPCRLLAANSPMEQKPNERTRETLEQSPPQHHDGAGDLLQNAKAEAVAFGTLVIVYACMMGAAPLIARYPDQARQLFCLSPRYVCDWRLWAVISAAAVLLVVITIAIKRRKDCRVGRASTGPIEPNRTNR